MRALDPAVFPVERANNWPCFGRVRISLSSEGHLNSTSNVNAHGAHMRSSVEYPALLCGGSDRPAGFRALRVRSPPNRIRRVPMKHTLNALFKKTSRCLPRSGIDA